MLRLFCLDNAINGISYIIARPAIIFRSEASADAVGVEDSERRKDCCRPIKLIMLFTITEF